MNNWKLIYDTKCQRDEVKIIRAGLGSKLDALICAIKSNPFTNPPPYEKLRDCDNCYSRRIDGKHRLVYEVYKKDKIVKILRMWSHYEQ
jgi:toxin YoeB